MDYRQKIYILGLSRKGLAERLGLSYASFSARLSGFTPWQANEEYALSKIIDAEFGHIENQISAELDRRKKGTTHV